MCREGIESLKHFMLECDKLQDVRNKYIELQRPANENTNKLLGEILFFEHERTEYYLDIVADLWKAREVIRETADQ